MDTGHATIKRLQLNRAELLVSRSDVIERALQILVLMDSVDPVVAGALADDLERLQDVESEYSAAVHAAVNFQSQLTG